MVDITKELSALSSAQKEFAMYGETFKFKKAALLQMSLAAFGSITVGTLRNKYKINIEQGEAGKAQVFETYLMSDDSMGVGHEVRVFFLNSVLKGFDEKRLKSLFRKTEVKEDYDDIEELTSAITLIVLPMLQDAVNIEKK